MRFYGFQDPVLFMMERWSLYWNVTQGVLEWRPTESVYVPNNLHAQQVRRIL